MASGSLLFPTITSIRQQQQAISPSNFTRPTANQIIFSSYSSISNLHLSFISLTFKPNSWSGRCRTTSPGPPSPPPEFGSNSDKSSASSSGMAESFIKFQDTAQIFLAVLCWMSLFFWSSAWDGKNNGRPNKRYQFRK